MEVKTENGGTFDAAGKGTTGLSIAGLVTGATALVGGGLLNMLGFANNNRNWGNNWDGNYGNYGHYCRMPMPNMATQEDVIAYARYDGLNAQLQKEKAERYTDQSIIAYNKDKFAFNKDIADAIVSDRQRIAALEQREMCMKEVMHLKEENFNLKLDNLKDKMYAGDAIEAERRSVGDQNLFNYVNGKYVPGKLVMPSDAICPEVMPRFNSWSAPTNAAPTNVTPTA